MFCISAELKFYQGIKGEWIGLFAWQDMGNLPPCHHHQQCGFQGQDIGNLPPCLYRSPSTWLALQKPIKHWLLTSQQMACQYRAMLGENQNQFSLTAQRSVRAGARKANSYQLF
jgi:hypothetical protein